MTRMRSKRSVSFEKRETMNTIHRVGDVICSIWAAAVAVGLMDVPSDRLIAVVAIWALSEALRSGWHTADHQHNIKMRSFSNDKGVITKWTS